MHLEATAVLFGAILWVMLKLSRAMVGDVEALCQMLPPRF